MSDCAHSWKPIPAWNARYRCEWCFALAYKCLVNGGSQGRQAAMRVYLCERKACGEPAVTHKDNQLCQTHFAEKKAKEETARRSG